jgi:DNA-binding protein H-NS
MKTYHEILQEIENLKAQAATARAAEISEGVAHIKAIMAEKGVTCADICRVNAGAGAGPRRSALAGSHVSIKYRDPATGATWTGRGKRPRWLAAKIEAGASVDSFKV